MATQSLFLSSFYPLRKMTANEIVEKIFYTDQYQDDDKFMLIEQTEDIIDGLYIIYYVSKELIYNTEKNEVQNIEIKRNMAVPFSIDLKNKILDIWGNKINAQKIILSLGLCLDNEIVIDSINISLSKAIDKLSSYKVMFSKVKVDNILIQENLVASYIINLSNYARPFDILEEYKNDICQLTFTLLTEISGDAATITMYSSGSVVIYKSKELLSNEILRNIKDICIGSRR
ncbi:hypothetical protein [Alkaliphilus transvaalensis]|uniref:hypothetical protein n=1 Tax=Alkaliphilus transvaalensis TaxID=114628 RepID=UPI0012EB8264|nr:hypothetical protein [Alkaliphilus transvaalensis]